MILKNSFMALLSNHIAQPQHQALFGMWHPQCWRHRWLQSLPAWNLFGTDGLCLNKAGALVLSADLHCSIHHPRAPLWSTYQLLTDHQSVTDWCSPQLLVLITLVPPDTLVHFLPPNFCNLSLTPPWSNSQQEVAPLCPFLPKLLDFPSPKLPSNGVPTE